MAIMSGNERFNAIMNGEDIDAEGPSIDVEINVIEKEAEVDESVEEMNEVDSQLNALLDTMHRVSNALDQADMVVDILLTDGINPVALKILSANRIFSDVWNIHLPSTESLDVVGANRFQAEMIAAAIEEKEEKAEGWLTKLWNGFIEWLKKKFGLFADKAEEKAEKIEEVIAKVNAIKRSTIDEEALKEKTASIIPVSAAKDLAAELEKCVKMLVDITQDTKLLSVSGIKQNMKDLDDAVEAATKKFNEAKEENITGSALVDALLDDKNWIGSVKSEGLGASVKDINNMKKQMDAAIKGLENAVEKLKDRKDDAAELDRSVINTVKTSCGRASTNIMNLYAKLQANYLTVATIILAAPRKEEKGVIDTVKEIGGKAKEKAKRVFSRRRK